MPETAADPFDDVPAAGHNSGVDADLLRSFIERVESLEAEKQTYVDDIKEVYGEAKGAGYDVKTIRKIVARRKKDREKLRAEDELLDRYIHALGIDR